MKSETSIGRFRLAQLSAPPSLDGARDYDLLLFGVSWKSRAVTGIERTGLRSGRTLCLRFASTDPAVVAAKDTTQRAYESAFGAIELFSLKSSLLFSENSALIERRLTEIAQEVGRPLRVLLDISCLPRSYATFIIGLGFVREIFGRVDCLYSEGQYTWEDTADSMGGPRSLISIGEWASLQIPYLEAQETIPAERDLLVEIGGEIGYSLPFVERYEPVRLGLIFIEGGVDPVLVNKNEASAYNSLIAEPKVDRVDYPIGDVVSVVEHIHGFCGADRGRVVTGLAIGSKAHALAMALAAVDLDNLELVCRIPTSYARADVLPTGNVFFYRAQDRFEPTSYFSR